jgi:hypothetical protein
MQPTQIIVQVSMKEVLQIHKGPKKTQFHSNNYPCQGKMKLDTIKEKKRD